MITIYYGIDVRDGKKKDNSDAISCKRGGW